MTYILFNPMSGIGRAEEAANKLSSDQNGASVKLDILEIKSFSDFFSTLNEDDHVIICGGDGTLHHFINKAQGIDIKPSVSYMPSGSGNDFARDRAHKSGDGPIPMDRYIKDLPTVEVNGKKHLFLNNVGYGIDGYCCEQGDLKRAKGSHRINYTTIAIKGVLYDFKPRNATVTVDGITKSYSKVWLAPTLKGLYFGGGMMATPGQDRLDPEKKVSVLVFHGSNRLHTLLMFPKIFTGEHIKFTKHTELLRGNDIEVCFDEPTPIQIDGETILGVRSYKVSAN